MKSATTLIRLLAAFALIGAGIIHTFPSIWVQWDALVQTQPNLHFQIGATGFILGISNLIILIYYIYSDHKQR